MLVLLLTFPAAVASARSMTAWIPGIALRTCHLHSTFHYVQCIAVQHLYYEKYSLEKYSVDKRAWPVLFVLPVCLAAAAVLPITLQAHTCALSICSCLSSNPRSMFATCTTSNKLQVLSLMFSSFHLQLRIQATKLMQLRLKHSS